MKVTVCSYDGKGYFGGPYEWVKRFGPALRDRGIEVSFLFYSDHSAKVSSTYLYLSNLGFNCQLLQVHSFSQYRDNTEDRVRWFLKQVKENPPDVFIPNTVLPAMYAGRWIKEAGIPVIGVLHSDDRSHDYMYDLFIAGSSEYSFSAVVGVSNLLKQKALKVNKFNIEVAEISCGTIIPNAIATFSSKPFKVIYAGKLTDIQKRITDTVRALCLLVKKEEDIIVEIYGAGSEKAKVESIINLEGCSDKVHLKGLINSSDIYQVFASGQVFVLLSDYEGLPVALMEAMGTGLVPVCSNIESGIPQLVKDHETGLLVKDREGDFCDAIINLKGAPELWNQLSVNALAFVMQEHEMSRVVEKWIHLFQVCLKKVRRSEIKIPVSVKLPLIHANLTRADQRKMTRGQFIVKQFYRGVYFLKKSLGGL